MRRPTDGRSTRPACSADGSAGTLATLDTELLDYPLPPGRIAQTPVEPRDAARLLVDRGHDRAPAHKVVADLPDLLAPGDLLVVNDTRVRPARLRLRKATGGAVEVLLLEPLANGTWEALVRPSRRVAPGTTVMSADGELAIVVDDERADGRRTVRVVTGDPVAYGEVPLPPYIHQALADPERYQTVYANEPGSVAAPTAGLHLTNVVLDRCRQRGIGVARVELRVGVDTFRPITEARVEDHPMHAEIYAVPAETMDACTRATRVVAVGTTVVRALEATAATGERTGRTDLFIRPGFQFRAVDALLTNFHLPRTTLLALVGAFVGPRWRDLYDVALAEGYRFLSFGDAMLVQRFG
jgi:S-adenosylmethionine:tRNA ribosyltransferase-isomerase